MVDLHRITLSSHQRSMRINKRAKLLSKINMMEKYRCVRIYSVFLRFGFLTFLERITKLLKNSQNFLMFSFNF